MWDFLVELFTPKATQAEKNFYKARAECSITLNNKQPDEVIKLIRDAVIVEKVKKLILDKEGRIKIKVPYDAPQAERDFISKLHRVMANDEVLTNVNRALKSGATVETRGYTLRMGKYNDLKVTKDM